MLNRKVPSSAFDCTKPIFLSYKEISNRCVYAQNLIAYVAFTNIICKIGYLRVLLFRLESQQLIVALIIAD